MKLYIAGPMTGLPEFNYPAFAAAERKLVAAGFEVLNPTGGALVAPKPEDAKPWDFYMRAGIRLLVDADAVATLPGWQQSQGATLEVMIAGRLGMPDASLRWWLQQHASEVRIRERSRG